MEAVEKQEQQKGQKIALKLVYVDESYLYTVYSVS